MLRNKEIKYLFISLVTFSFIVIGMAVMVFSGQVAIFLSLICFLFIASYLIFTSWRYGKLRELSHELQRISNGDYKLDLRDNSEGELSILKNDIYKVTHMLAEQSSYLNEDRQKLSAAISDISHQLKTPLTSMIIMTDLLSDANLDEKKRKEFTNNISTQLERMEWLVSSLLKLSKIDAGTISFKEDAIPLELLINKAVESILIPMDIKEISLIKSGNSEALFKGDMNWTVEALINILKNCVEHTVVGGEIRIQFGENALYSEIMITDNGKGIAKADLPYIFQRFYKGKNASDESVGIGLAMAHSIITHQQGDVEVVSEEGKGTRFHIKFYKQVIS